MSGVGTTKHQVYSPFATRSNKKVPRGLDCDNCGGEREKGEKGHTETVLLLFLLQNHADLQHGIAQQETLHYQESLS